MVWFPSLCVEEGVVASAEGKDEVCALTLMKMMVQSQVSIRTPIICCEELHHLTCTLPNVPYVAACVCSGGRVASPQVS